VQGVEAAQAVEHRAQRRVVAVLDRARELLEHDEVDPRAGDVDDVVLAVDEHGEGVLARVDPTLQPARRAGEDVPLAPADQLELRLAPQEVGAVVAAGEQAVGEPGEQTARRGALGDDPDRLTAEELRDAERVELAELVAVVGEEVLGAELEQDGVVALERREDIGVGLQRGEAVGLEVAGAAARLAARLDRVGRMPRGDRLEAGGERLELAPGPVVGLRARREDVVQVPAQARLGEVQPVRRGERGERRRWCVR